MVQINHLSRFLSGSVVLDN